MVKLNFLNIKAVAETIKYMIDRYKYINSKFKTESKNTRKKGKYQNVKNMSHKCHLWIKGA